MVGFSVVVVVVVVVEVVVVDVVVVVATWGDLVGETDGDWVIGLLVGALVLWTKGEDDGESVGAAVTGDSVTGFKVVGALVLWTGDWLGNGVSGIFVGDRDGLLDGSRLF